MAYTVVEVPSRGLKSYGLIVMAYMDTAFTVLEVTEMKNILHKLQRHGKV